MSIKLIMLFVFISNFVSATSWDQEFKAHNFNQIQIEIKDSLNCIKTSNNMMSKIENIKDVNKKNKISKNLLNRTYNDLESNFEEITSEKVKNPYKEIIEQNIKSLNEEISLLKILTIEYISYLSSINARFVQLNDEYFQKIDSILLKIHQGSKVQQENLEKLKLEAETAKQFLLENWNILKSNNSDFLEKNSNFGLEHLCEASMQDNEFHNTISFTFSDQEIKQAYELLLKTMFNFDYMDSAIKEIDAVLTRIFLKSEEGQVIESEIGVYFELKKQIESPFSKKEDKANPYTIIKKQKAFLLKQNQKWEIYTEHLKKEYEVSLKAKEELIIRLEIDIIEKIKQKLYDQEFCNLDDMKTWLQNQKEFLTKSLLSFQS